MCRNDDRGGRVRRQGLRWVLAIGLGAGCAAAQAQAVDAKVCDVINHPKQFDGKMVRLKGVVQADYDSFVLRGDSCTSALWLSYPAGTKAKSGPAAIVTLQLAANSAGTPGTARAALTLDHNKDFDSFEMLLTQRPKTPGMCMACPKNDVMATLTGRVDGTDNAGLTRDKDGKITGLDGFGNMNAYSARLVITSVADATAKEIDYSKAPKVDGDNQGGSGKDYVAIARKTEASFPKDSPPIAEIEQALAALGAPGTDNGVTVGFGNVANVPDGEGTKSSKSSPDGLLLTVLVDMDRLKGDALARAITHQGAEVLALREKSAGSPREIELKAWQTALDVVLGARQKSFTLPGGVVLWSDGWTAAEKNANATAALTSYIEDREETPR
jgi:hypothetical protein